MALPLSISSRVVGLIAPLPAAGALTLCMTAAQPAQAQQTALRSFDNGGFENPVVPAQTFMTFAAGGTIGPWRVTAGTVDLIGSGFWQTAEGVQSIDLDGSDSGTIEQPVQTRFGGCYTVTYALAGNPDGGPVIKRGFARVAQIGSGHPPVQRNFAFDAIGKSRTDMGYVQQRFRFRALGHAVMLSFGSTTPGAYGPVIDGVTVTQTHPRDCHPGHM
jgi:choice-of-anchor C domain-containing protein